MSIVPLAPRIAIVRPGSTMSDTSPPKVAVVVSGWPSLSEVFALDELTALHAAGMLAAVLALDGGESGRHHAAPAWLTELVEFVPAGGIASQGAFVAERGADVGAAAVHGYFAHEPAAVAAEAAQCAGLPFGFSLHALDAGKVSRPALAERVRRAVLVVACDGDAADEVTAAGGCATLVRHGVDLAAFPASDPPDTDPVSVLAVARFVETDGFDVLFRALAQVDRSYRLTLVGDGVLWRRLRALAEELRIADRVRFAGTMTHQTLSVAYAAADIVVVPSTVDRNGECDGLPNVVLEAMASQRPVVGSEVTAIPTAVHYGETGVPVRPRHAVELAGALTALIDDPKRRRLLGAAGRAFVETDFDLDNCTRKFCATLSRAYG